MRKKAPERKQIKKIIIKKTQKNITPAKKKYIYILDATQLPFLASDCLLRRLDHRSSEASVYRREAAVVARHRAGRPDGGRGAGGVLFMTGSFEREGESIVF